MAVGTRQCVEFSGSLRGPSSGPLPTVVYATEQFVVPKSIAAMLRDGTRKPDSVLGTRLATSQPLDVFLTSPTVAIFTILCSYHCNKLRMQLNIIFCTVSTSGLTNNINAHLTACVRYRVFVVSKT